LQNGFCASCPTNQVAVNGSCVPVSSTPTCTLPQVLQNGVCAPCPTNQVPRNGVCVPASTPVNCMATFCDPQQFPTTLACPAPSTWQNGMCVEPCLPPSILAADGSCWTVLAPTPIL
jgi:hypothetical protein